MNVTRHTHRRSVRKPARGFSLVELMVAIAIGLILMAGLAVLFANSSQSGNEIEKSVRQIENGRYALELLNEDVSVAGYYGEVSTTGITLGAASACAGGLSGLHGRACRCQLRPHHLEVGRSGTAGHGRG